MLFCRVLYPYDTPLSSRHLRNEYRQKQFCDFDFNKNGGYRGSWDSQMWESRATMWESWAMQQ